MIWETSWEGIYFTAENDEDEKVLKHLLDLLPPKPSQSYEGGGYEIREVNGRNKVMFWR